MPHRPARRLATVLICSCLLLLASLARAETPATVPAAAPAPVEFTAETLDNGLEVIYAPLHQAPVVHVRLIYHVGSRDERPDRQGFAHMFEHMMFRGSAHVAPEQHMKLISQVGGFCNAFTSFDQTTYFETLPSNNLEMALYLEADRMASFKVSDAIFKTERKVVSEEWRMRYANQPYGMMFTDFAKTAYTTHSYRWTPIGKMEQLKSAASSELQEFFNRYYVPNNACLVLAGDIDIDQAKAYVRKYFGWIPRGGDVPRNIPAEPPQAEQRELVVYKKDVPLPSITMGYKTVGYRSDDHYALGLLGQILTSGRTSRLDRLLVNSPNPLCRQVGGGDQQLEDPSLFMITAGALPGKDPQQIIKVIDEALADVVNNGVTPEELEKTRTQVRVGIIRSRETADSLARQLGEEAVFGGDPNRVNQEWEKVQKLTPADLQAVARKYLRPEHRTIIQYLPDPQGTRSHPETATSQLAAKATEAANAEVAPSTTEVPPRQIAFPEGYPTQPPMADVLASRPFEKGVEMEADGVKVIVLSDHRLPLVNFSLVMRSGGDAEPAGKDGLAGMTAAMLRRGAGDMDYLALSQDLESRAISIEASDAGDTTRLGASCTTDQLEHTIQRARQVLLQPTFPEAEFNKLKRQSLAGLMQALSNPGTVAERELSSALYGDSPLGRHSTLESLGSITLADVKSWYASVYKPNNAILIVSGDISPEQGKQLAGKLLADWKPAESLPQADYTLPEPSSQRRIILVDNPEGRQSTIRMGIRAFTIKSEDKFPGSLAGRILSDGIHSRLDRYVRAEKGYTYGSAGYFSPGRHGGAFDASVDTNPATTTPCIEAMFKVFNDMRRENVTPEEISEAKSRVAGSMVMQMQTIAQQAERRLDGILNGYPIDYYDVYPQRIARVSADDVRAVMDKYVRDEAMTIVVVAPAAEVRQQLEQLGAVQVVPMPARRPGAAAVAPAAGPAGPASPATPPTSQPSA